MFEFAGRACTYGLCVSIHHGKRTLGQRNFTTRVVGGASTLRRVHTKYKLFIRHTLASPNIWKSPQSNSVNCRTSIIGVVACSQNLTYLCCLAHVMIMTDACPWSASSYIIAQINCFTEHMLSSYPTFNVDNMMQGLLWIVWEIFLRGYRWI